MITPSILSDRLRVRLSDVSTRVQWGGEWSAAASPPRRRRRRLPADRAEEPAHTEPSHLAAADVAPRRQRRKAVVALAGGRQPQRSLEAPAAAAAAAITRQCTDASRHGALVRRPHGCPSGTNAWHCTESFRAVPSSIRPRSTHTHTPAAAAAAHARPWWCRRGPGVLGRRHHTPPPLSVPPCHVRSSTAAWRARPSTSCWARASSSPCQSTAARRSSPGPVPHKQPGAARGEERAARRCCLVIGASRLRACPRRAR